MWEPGRSSRRVRPGPAKIDQFINRSSRIKQPSRRYNFAMFSAIKYYIFLSTAFLSHRQPLTYHLLCNFLDYASISLLLHRLLRRSIPSTACLTNSRFQVLTDFRFFSLCRIVGTGFCVFYAASRFSEQSDDVDGTEPPKSEQSETQLQLHSFVP
ncbi:hypothetical protein L1887_31510 [Cichorium endivia]|nr:hypothetical protein L1887_31510 [Cichorium endivia]